MAAWIGWQEGLTLGQMAEEINAELGTRYTGPRISDWRDGRRSVPGPVQAVMRRDVLCYVLGEDLGSCLAPRLEPPKR